MALEHVVAIGGSAGAIDAVRVILSELGPDFPAAVFVVIHTSAQSPGIVVDILHRASAMPVGQARNGERIRPGEPSIYACPGVTACCYD